MAGGKISVDVASRCGLFWTLRSGKAGHVQEIVGCSRRAEHLQEAVDLGVIDRFDTDAAHAVEGHAIHS